MITVDRVRGSVALTIGTALWALQGCGSASGGAEIVVATAQTVEQQEANPESSGARVIEVLPGDDLQLAANGLQPGDTLRLMSGSHRVASLIGSEGLSGLRLSNSGTAGTPIVVEGAPGAILDQARDGSAADGAVAGLVVDCASHLILRDLTIRNVDIAGVTTSMSGCQSEGLTIERLTIVDVYGAGYAAAIRLANVRDVTLRNNELSGVLAGNATAAAALPASGAVEQVVIENNRFETTGAGVAMIADGMASTRGITVRRNEFVGASAGVLVRTGTDTQASFRDVTIDANLFENVASAGVVELGGSRVQSSGFSFSSNTVAGTSSDAWVQSGAADVTILDNVFTDLGRDAIVSERPASAAVRNDFARIDHNVYDDAILELAWTLDLGGNAVRPIGLAAWQALDAGDPMLGLRASPDPAGVAALLAFEAASEGDYRLTTGSPGADAASDGGEPGAFADGVRPGPLPDDD